MRALYSVHNFVMAISHLHLFSVPHAPAAHTAGTCVCRTVGPFEPVRAVATIVPWSTGEHLLAAKFYSKQLNDVDGFLRILVKPRLENTGSILEDGSTELGRM